MNTYVKRKILQRISTLENDIDVLKKVRVELATSGYASATLASSSGSKSYTRLDISKVQEAISQLEQELKKTRNLLSGRQGFAPTSVLTVYS